MTILEAIENRRSIRKYQNKAISEDDKNILNEKIAELNTESGLHIQLLTGKPEAFKSFLAHYGGFENAENYLALVGKRSADLDEKCGYYGEQIVLLAQQLGLSTCWIGGSFNKRAAFYECANDEKLSLIISIGYPAEEGRVHKSKTYEQVTKDCSNAPDWFRKGIEAALLAPTAVNQQKFIISMTPEGNVTAKAGIGPFSKVDLGIVKLHFEIGSGTDHSIWR